MNRYAITALSLGALAVLYSGRSEGVKLDIDLAHIIVCRNANVAYFIRPSGIVYLVQGANGMPNCIVALDTEGRDHFLCREKESPDVCDLVEPGPDV